MTFGDWISQSHILSNISTIIVLVAAVWGIVFVARHKFWGPRLKNAFSKKLPVVALIIAVIYLSIAMLDSLAWKDSMEGEGNALQASEPRTIIDRLFSAAVSTPEWEYREKSFVAPFGEVEYMKQTEKSKFDNHILGTNKTGYDTLYLILKGCRPAIVIGTLPLLFSVPLALAMGVLAGFFGGKIDEIVVYIYTTLSSIPGLLLMIALITALGKGLPQIALGLGVTGWVGLCRLVRAETLKLRELEYIQAAKCLGVPTWKTLLKHIVPNLMHIVIITCILSFTGLVLSESILAYLGIGLNGSWGGMIDNARSEIAQDPVIWWNIIAASVALFMLVLSVNVVGDTLRDALDPRTSSE